MKYRNEGGLPQNVVSKTMLLLLKCSSMSQAVPPTKDAVGLPHVDGSGELPEMPLGTLPRLKNQMLMALLVHSIA